MARTCVDGKLHVTPGYTEAGLDWIDDNTMITVLLRHYPHLEDALRAIENGFHPWNAGAA